MFDAQVSELVSVFVGGSRSVNCEVVLKKVDCLSKEERTRGDNIKTAFLNDRVTYN